MKFIILNLKFKTSAWKWPLRHGRLLSDAILLESLLKTNSLESMLLRSINHFCVHYHLHSKSRYCSFAYLISKEPESLAISISQLHRIILAFCKDSLDYSKLGL